MKGMRPAASWGHARRLVLDSCQRLSLSQKTSADIYNRNFSQHCYSRRIFLMEISEGKTTHVEKD